MARRGYVQLVNGFYDNDKIRDLVRMGRADSVGVYCMALSLCGDRLTDGFISRRALLSNIGATPEQVRALVDEGMLEEVDEGWIIHNYTVHNRTKEQVLHARADAKERKSKSRHHATVTSMSQRDIAVTSGQTPEHQNTRMNYLKIIQLPLPPQSLTSMDCSTVLSVFTRRTGSTGRPLRLECSWKSNGPRS